MLPQTLNKKIAVASLNSEKNEEAKNLARNLDLHYLADLKEMKQFDYLLMLSTRFLGLYHTADKKLTPFYIDFSTGKIFYRHQHALFRNELIAKAMGVKPKDKPFIVDATAGLGRDSFILATLGFDIVLLERSPILYSLLMDAMTRAEKTTNLLPVITRMHLILTDAREWLLSSVHQRPDIIYLDPMFPKRKKSAAVKKEMRILQELLSDEGDTGELFNLSLSCAAKRVVVKRPRIAENMNDQKPDYSLTGQNSRFDIYLTQK